MQYSWSSSCGVTVIKVVLPLCPGAAQEEIRLRISPWVILKSHIELKDMRIMGCCCRWFADPVLSSF